MMNFKNMMIESELSAGQLLFLYEVAQIGIIRFDINNPNHADILERLVNVVAQYSEDDYKDEPLCIQLERKNKFDIYRMILVELLANSIRKVGIDNEKDG